MDLIVEPIVQGLLMGGVYSLIAIGLTLVFGVQKVVNFAHGEFIMLPMYLSFGLFTFLHMDPYLSLVVSIPVFFGLGYLIQRTLIAPALNSPELNQIVLTLGISVFLMNLALFLWRSDYHLVRPAYSDAVITVPILGLRLGLSRVLGFLVSVVVSGAFYWFMKSTRLGTAIRATSQNRRAASLMGIRVAHIDGITFGLGAALAAVAGTAVSLFHPVWPSVGHVFVLKAFVIVVLGGMGDFVGALLGGLIIGVVESTTAVWISSAYKEVASFALFILVLLFRPWGIFGRRVA